MSVTAITRGTMTRVLAVVVALATVAAALMVATPEAKADNRGYLRPGCHWDSYGHWVQNCGVYSPAMQREIRVQIVPSRSGGNAGLYLLDGMRAREDWNGWTFQGHAPRTFMDSNITLVMPVGGAASFYSDWIAPARNAHGERIYKWETFLTQELPHYLAQNFGVSPNNNSVAGLSMGATAAMNLAAHHRNQFRQVVAMSGYYHTTAPGMATMLGFALFDTAGYSSLDMWGLPLSPQRMYSDPWMNVDKMRGLDMYVSSASGIPGAQEMHALHDPSGLIAGMTLESIANASTMDWEIRARIAGLNPTMAYHPTGIHSWDHWSQDLRDVRPRVLSYMNAW